MFLVTAVLDQELFRNLLSRQNSSQIYRQCELQRYYYRRLEDASATAKRENKERNKIIMPEVCTSCPPYFRLSTHLNSKR